MSQFSRYATPAIKETIANATYVGDANEYRVMHLGPVKPGAVKIMIVDGPEGGIPIGATITVPEHRVTPDCAHDGPGMRAGDTIYPNGNPITVWWCKGCGTELEREEE